MPTRNVLLKVAAALAVLAALLEIYVAASSVAEVKRGANYSGVMLYVIPLIVIAGAGLIARGDDLIGAGIVVNALALQHILVEIRPAHFLPLALAALSVIICIYLDGRQPPETAASGVHAPAT